MRPLSPAELALFRQTAQRRTLETQAQVAQRLVDARRVAAEAADLLKQEFQATQVVVFGSLVHPERFHQTSDIDLAVAGLSPLDYFAAVARLQDLSVFKVDLVRLERCLRG
ncbi:nucleotidyltransferase family protein [Nodosilinea sp. PGN35]|uniref:nucleotidyltransferase family protein n=1 Tax=Nodosilinea sp. PGN35 TaxID=3020489 RepID=UPI0023B356F8|nr:nucleotidyltransferase domain-containing protein [Nodosilinea sp. TSF1-S3]MDF0369925.1 nucleotidyltransferase domain-containing protein [Nodosilinea sp. TSF1-S3]